MEEEEIVRAFRAALESGQESTVENPNPANLHFTFTTDRGSFIRFTVPAGGSVTFKSVGDLGITLTIGELRPARPRPID